MKEWLCNQIPNDARKTIGQDIRAVQLGWPIGRPLVGSLKHGLWEVRSTHLKVEYRVFFTIVSSTMVLLHGIIKKTQATPPSELITAKARQKEVE
ncbi:MAG: type II toxin-antitoxin system RelE/ParE family toxin [Polyangiaceae bacterium]